MNRRPALRASKADRPELPDHDPPPLPPQRPESADCCRGGCDTCVFDLYDAELERYEAALRAWRERHKDRPRPTLKPGPTPQERAR